MAYSSCSLMLQLLLLGFVLSLAAAAAAAAKVDVAVLQHSSAKSHNSLPPCAIWCVCKDGPEAVLQKTLDYACGHGGDCGPIRPNGACYSPDSVRAHCSYAVNSYFHKMNKAGATCDFSTTATITASDPSSSGCSYPAVEASPAGSTSPATSPPKSTPMTPRPTPMYGNTPPTTSSPYTSARPPPGSTPSTGVLGGGGMGAGTGMGMGPPGMDMYDNNAGLIVLSRWSVACWALSMLTLCFWN